MVADHGKYLRPMGFVTRSTPLLQFAGCDLQSFAIFARSVSFPHKIQ